MKSVVVTGSSTGIGYHISKKLVDNGFRVFGSVRNIADGEKVSSEIGPNFLPLVFDVTNENAVKESVNQVNDFLDGQKLSGLVNNAGIGVIGAVQNLTSEEFKYQFEVNLLGVFHCTQAYMDLLGADKNRKGSPGKIINISSISGELGMPFMAAYNMSKFGLEGFSEAVRRELMIFGIDVIVIAPGPVKTPIWKKFNKEELLKRYDNSTFRESISKVMNFTEKLEAAGISPEIIANRVMSILTNAKTKTRYRIDSQRSQNRILSFLPKRIADKMIAKQMKLIKK